jgi:hypothetical protein
MNLKAQNSRNFSQLFVMRTLCLFSSYFNQPIIPNYIKYYLEELNRHADEVWFLSNEKKIPSSELTYLERRSIKWMLSENKGYDFGQWFRALQHMEPTKYDRLILANDSCILFNDLGPLLAWCESSGVDYGGLTDSAQLHYHPQSYFLYVSKRAIPLVVNYLQSKGEIAKTQSEAVHIFEIGLARTLQGQGLLLGAFISYKDIQKLAHLPSDYFDPSFDATFELLKVGAPFIKRRLVMGEYKPGELLRRVAKGTYIPLHQIRSLVGSYSTVPMKQLLGNYKNKETTLWGLARKIAIDALSVGPLSDLYRIIYERDLRLGLGALYFVLKQSGDFAHLRHAAYWLKHRLLRDENAKSPFAT